MQEIIQPKGQIEISIKHRDGTVDNILVKNTVLKKGREALASSLAHDFSSYEFYIDRMLFGTGGVDGENPKYVDASMSSLYTPDTDKPISAVIDPLRPHEVVFTSVLTFDDAAIAISEMGLRMANNDLYSMATFPVINKTEDMQITWSWRLSWV